MPNSAPTITFGSTPVQRLGASFRVNTQTAGSQETPLVVALAGGAFVVVWRNGTESTRLQMFDSDGVPIGGEVMVNTNDVGLQFDARIEPLAGGGFVVAWLDTQGDGPGVGGSAVKAQLFSATGAKIGGEILVNPPTDKVQSSPNIAELANGDFVITWSETTYNTSGGFPVYENSEIRAQRFGSDGTKLGGEIFVNTTTDEGQSGAEVAALAGGGFVVTWADDSETFGNFNANIRAQFFTAAGAKVGAEILVNTAVNDSQIGPEITNLANGNVLITWEDQSGPPAQGADVRAQIFTQAGAKVGAEILVNTIVADDQYDAAVHVLESGQFVIVWMSGVAQNTDLIAQLFSADGVKIGGEFMVNGSTDGSASMPEIAGLPGGGIAISWTAVVGDEQLPSIRMQVFDASLNKVGDEIAVSTPAQGSAHSPQSAISDGQLLVVWTGGDENGILAQLFSADPLVVQGTQLDLKGEISIGDVDAGGGLLTVQLSVDAGTLNVSPGSSGATVGGSGTGSVTITGTLAQINALLLSDPSSTVSYFAPAGASTTVTLTVNVNDNGNSGGPAQIATATLEIEVVQQITAETGPPINGTPGDDDLTGTAIGETINGLDGNDILRGEGGDDVLNGGGGDDYLVGGAGTDTMVGGSGSDTYYAADASDLIIEPVAIGIDRVAALVSYALHPDADIELLEAINLHDTVAMDLTGNQFGQSVVGNDGVNTLRGEGGSDELTGLNGDDFLHGGDGDDILRGGAGNDTMAGGAGSDKYYVEDAGDVLVEAVAPGDDRVAASVSYTLTAGADIEYLEPVTFNSTEALNFTGNVFSNVILGNNGANVLNGGLRADVLEGLGGADSFLFDSALGSGNVDRIADFLSGTDRILLDDAIFTGLNAGALPAGAFVTGTIAQDADDRIVYDSATGALYYDADGNGSVGAMIQFATVTAGLTINASDFLVI